MKMILCLILLSSAACSKNNSDSPVLPETKETPQFPDHTEGPEEIPSREVDERDVVSINELLPTMYYVPQEKLVSCKGRYGGRQFSGKERTVIRNLSGAPIATVCTRFYRFITMEGTGILRNGRTINVSGKVNGSHRFHYTSRCQMGEGIAQDLCLLPYHTIAADNRVHAVGEIIYIPAAKGIVLPDGTSHEGYFIVRDTGSAFTGIGAQRVDLFVGLDLDYRNAFQAAGFHHKNPLEAFKIYGESAEIIKERLKAKFPELF